MLKNYTEVVIDNELPIIFQGYKDTCTCNKCVEDIKALALNQLKPLYMVTEKGNMYLKLNELETQFKTDVTAQLVKAVEIVSKNPRHAMRQCV